jgi:hypothetical protein
VACAREIFRLAAFESFLRLRVLTWGLMLQGPPPLSGGCALAIVCKMNLFCAHRPRITERRVDKVNLLGASQYGTATLKTTLWYFRTIGIVRAFNIQSPAYQESR